MNDIGKQEVIILFNIDVSNVAVDMLAAVVTWLRLFKRWQIGTFIMAHQYRPRVVILLSMITRYF